MRLLNGAQQSAGNRERLTREQFSDGTRDFLAELGRAIVEGLREHEQADGVFTARAGAIDEPRAVLAHLALDDRVTPDPDTHAVARCRRSGSRRAFRHRRAAIWRT